MTLLTIFFATSLTATLLAIAAYGQAKKLKRNPVRVTVKAHNQKKVPLHK